MCAAAVPSPSAASDSMFLSPTTSHDGCQGCSQIFQDFLFFKEEQLCVKKNKSDFQYSVILTITIQPSEVNLFSVQYPFT